MGWRCYMIEKVNERTVEIPEGTCTDDDCDFVEPAHTEVVFDVRRVDTGEVLQEAATWIGHHEPPGAMWWADMREQFLPAGPDDWSDRDEAGLEDLRRSVAEHPALYPNLLASGLPVRRPTFLFAPGPQLCVMTPGGRWVITSRASNCTMPYDYEHRCWVVHGDPPAITVDKDGVTCSAGGGSIQAGDFHGFLRGGELG